MPFACIFVPNFPLAAVFRAEPELRARALAILDGKPPLEKVFAGNEGASLIGITPGMTKAQAELCPELTLRPRSSLQESSTHAALLDCSHSFSPRVEDAAPDTALLDIEGMESLFGPLPRMAHAMSCRITRLGLEANVAIASNPDAAQLAACGFSGVTVIPPGGEAEFLGSLPVEVLFTVPWEEKEGGRKKEDDRKMSKTRLLETLDRWGVRNLRALAALPAIALSERLGQEGLRLQQLARGAGTRTLVPVEAPAVFEEAVELEHPIVLLEPLAFLLNRLLEQVCARLDSRSLHTQELRLTLELQHPPDQSGHTFCRTLRLPLPMLDAKLFLKLLQLDLNAHPPGAPIVKIHLAAPPARPRSSQGGLFQPPSPEPEKLELTLARLAGLVGEARVGSFGLLDSHRADNFRMRRFVPEVTPKKAARENQPGKASEQAESKFAIAALRRFRPPLRVTVTLENGEPVRVACPKKKEAQGSVLWKAGPWRHSGDWWERDAWSRDEWDIALQNAEGLVLYRLVHDLLSAGWFLEGTYD
jgi:protein ImuB